MFEEGFFTPLQALLPAKAQAVAVADRGFHRAELARRLQAMGPGDVIRVNGTTYFASESHIGRLVRPGENVDIELGAYRKSRPGLRMAACEWLRMHFGMHVEQLFRDEKNLRFG